MVSIKELRQRSGWSQHELGARVGVTAVTVYNWERGQYDPRPRELRKLAKLFGLTSSDEIALPTDQSRTREDDVE